MADDVKASRTVGLVGQGGSGKTSLGDALLHVSGVVNRLDHHAEHRESHALNIGGLGAHEGGHRVKCKRCLRCVTLGSTAPSPSTVLVGPKNFVTEAGSF